MFSTDCAKSLGLITKRKRFTEPDSSRISLIYGEVLSNALKGAPINLP
jgi:hypothetical protein